MLLNFANHIFVREPRKRVKPKFKVDDIVRIKNCSHISGLTGTVLGMSSRTGVVDFMIVMLDDPLPSGQKAVTVIDSCLELIETELTEQESLQAYITWIEDMYIRYEEALRLCISRAENPDPVEGCRLVIDIAKAALDEDTEKE